MPAEPPVWRIERHEDVREDAPGYFVPSTELPEAAIGDRVVVTAASSGQERWGTVSDVLDDDVRGRFVVVDLE